MARFFLNILSIFKRPAKETGRTDRPHIKQTFYGMSLVLLSMVCFIFILWVIMTIVRLFSGFAG